MTYWQMLILAAVEAVTEFLPVSSTAHLILTNRLLGVPETDFLTTFEIVIQLGAIAAVLVFFWQRLWQHKNWWPKIGLAFIPTAVLGALAYPVIKNYLLKGQLVTGIALILGGLVMMIWEKKCFKDESKQLTLNEVPTKKIWWVGIWQALSFVPGVSRSAASILGGMKLGLKRSEAVELAFLLAIPTMLAASGLDLLKTLIDGYQAGSITGMFSGQEWLTLGLGTGATFIFSLLVVKFLIKWLNKKNSFWWFGIYRLAIGAIWLAVFWQR